MATRSSKERSREIRDFIVGNIAAHPSDITRLTAEKFGISRQAAHKYVNKLVADGTLTTKGETRDRRYELKPIAVMTFSIPLTPELKEDVVWREKIRPQLGIISPNVLNICEYGFTEILNNAIDHSEGKTVSIMLKRFPTNIKITIFDDGVGIFKKIQSRLNLEDERHAILELAKGKLTTEPSHHTGEGIFFTSRIFDLFSIFSGTLAFLHNQGKNDWLFENHEDNKGTSVFMEIHPNSTHNLQDVFDKYTSDGDNYGFTKTIVPVTLAKYGDENLISRSQAKRLLARFEKFKEVVLDFKGVNIIGQAFADEIFRVFQAQNPNVAIRWTNENEDVRKMILRASA